MPQAEDLMGRLLEEYAMVRDPGVAQQPAIADFVLFCRDMLNKLPVTGLAADIRGMALQMGDGTVVFLNTNSLEQQTPGEHPGHSFIGNMPSRRTIGTPGLHGGDVNIFSPKKT